MSIPVSVNAQTLSAEMAAKPGPKQVRAVATVFMPKESEGQISVATRYVLVLDCSGSTGNQLEG